MQWRLAAAANFLPIANPGLSSVILLLKIIINLIVISVKQA